MTQMMLPGGSLLNFNRLIRDMVTYRVLANAKLSRRKRKKGEKSRPFRPRQCQSMGGWSNWSCQGNEAGQMQKEPLA